MKNSLHSDWLKAVQLKCNTSAKCTTAAKSVTPVQLKHCNCGLICCNFLSQWHQVKQWQKFCRETLKNVFSNAKKMASRKMFQYNLYTDFFMLILLISNHTIFSCSIWDWLALVSFSKSWNCTCQSGSCNCSFLKYSLVQINSKLNEKKMYDYLYQQNEAKCENYRDNFRFI